MAAVYARSLGMLPSACLSANPNSGKVFGIYESTSESPPDIAEQGIANPIGMILSIGLMFDYTVGRTDLRHVIEAAVNRALNDGISTADIGGTANSKKMTTAILDRIVL